MSGERASAMIERLPSARGPNSIRPWNQPSALPSARSAAVRAISASSSSRVKRAPAAVRRPALSSSSKAGPEIGAVHAVEPVVDLAPVAFVDVIRRERGAERAAGIARGRLDPDALEFAVAQHLAVGHAVERHAAGEAQILRAGLACERARQAQHDFLRDRLDRGGEIHVALGQQLVGLARRRAEQAIELVVRHAQAGAIVEI